MRKQLVGFIALITLTALLSGCGSPNNVTVQPASAQAAEGLDLQAVGALVHKAKTAQELEGLLNDPNTGINNLDLNQDGKVDYLNVTEFGTGNSRGFSITDDLGDGNVQEVAQILVEKSSPTQATVQVAGNQQIYGDNAYYGSSFSLGDAVLLSWLFTPHPVYVSPYHWGYYPSGYGYYAPAPIAVYRTRTQAVTRSTTIQRTSTSTIRSAPVSPNAGRTANNIRAPLSKPTETQRQFQVRDTSKPAGSGGFGRPSSASASTSQPRSGSSAPARTSAPSASRGGGFGSGSRSSSRRR